MQILAKSHTLATLPNLALLGSILVTISIGHISAGKLDIYEHPSIEEHDHHHYDHDEEFHMQPNAIKCPLHEQEPEAEAEPFESPHMMSDLLQDGRKKHGKTANHNNDIKMPDRWQIISDQINKLDEIWPSIMKHFGNKFKTEQKGFHMLDKSGYNTAFSSGIKDFQMDLTKKKLNDNQDSWTKMDSRFPSKETELEEQNKPVQSDTAVPIIAAKNTISQEKQQIVSNYGSENKQQPIKKAEGIKDSVGYPLMVTTEKLQETTVYSPETKHHDKISELEQQGQNRWMEPIMLHFEEQNANSAKNPRTQVIVSGQTQKQFEVKEESQGSDENRQKVSHPAGRAHIEITEPPASQRVRNSLLKAADIARHLNARQNMKAGVVQTQGHNLTERESDNLNDRAPSLNESYPITTSTGYEGLESSSRNSAETTTTALPSESSWENILNDGESKPRPRFLGYGDVQKNEPINESGRIQVRLSCQFGDESMRNITISKVEWARFVGPYDKEQASFECQDQFCRLIPIQTDTMTTVHPRPEVQTYLNTRVPAYSMTLHSVEEGNYGVYRCSALRQSIGEGEIVYRIIPLE